MDETSKFGEVGTFRGACRGGERHRGPWCCEPAYYYLALLHCSTPCLHGEDIDLASQQAQCGAGRNRHHFLFIHNVTPSFRHVLPRSCPAARSCSGPATPVRPPSQLPPYAPSAMSAAVSGVSYFNHFAPSSSAASGLQSALFYAKRRRTTWPPAQRSDCSFLLFEYVDSSISQLLQHSSVLRL